MNSTFYITLNQELISFLWAWWDPYSRVSRKCSRAPPPGLYQTNFLASFYGPYPYDAPFFSYIGQTVKGHTHFSTTKFFLHFNACEGLFYFTFQISCHHHQRPSSRERPLVTSCTSLIIFLVQGSNSQNARIWMKWSQTFLDTWLLCVWSNLLLNKHAHACSPDWSIQGNQQVSSSNTVCIYQPPPKVNNTLNSSYSSDWLKYPFIHNTHYLIFKLN